MFWNPAPIAGSGPSGRRDPVPPGEQAVRETLPEGR